MLAAVCTASGRTPTPRRSALEVGRRNTHYDVRNWLKAAAAAPPFRCPQLPEKQTFFPPGAV